jgi:hypothetical protein
MKRFLVGLLVAATATIGFGSVAFASTGAWTEFVYNSSGNALKGVAVSTIGDTTTFKFAPNVYTALLTTSDKSLTGDLTGRTLSATVSVTGMNPATTFLEQNGGGCTPDSQYVRLYFNSGGTGAGGQRGFYTTFWWSNPVHVNLVNDGFGNVAPSTMNVTVDPTQWSDWNGTPGSTVPDAFNTAATKVLSVGLSFGGGCFFENGVTTSDGSGAFSSTFSETP